MNFSQIYEGRDKDPVDELKGRVIRVFEPQAPTEAQARTGIHSQTIMLMDEAGTQLKLQMIRPEVHLPKGAEGEIYFFRCVDGEGLSINRWRPNNSPEDEVCVKVDRKAHFYAVEQTPQQRAAYEASKPQLGDLVDGYCAIFAKMEEKMAGSKLWDSFIAQPQALTAATSTIFIEANRQGMLPLKKVLPVVLPAIPAQGRKEPDEPPNREPEDRVKGAPVDRDNEPDEEPERQVAMLATSRISREKLKAFCDKQSQELNFTRVYDHMTDSLLAMGWTKWEVDKAHDAVREAIREKLGKAPTESQLYTTIAMNFDRFEKARPAPPKNPNFVAGREQDRPTGDDDFGLPTL